MRASMRRLINLGSGRKKDSWESTSATSCECASVNLAFMMRTMAASMATVRSSSTRFGLWLSSSRDIGMRILRMGQVNASLNAYTSVTRTPFCFSAGFSLLPSPPSSPPAAALPLLLLLLPLLLAAATRFKILYFPHASEWMTRLSTSSGRARLCCRVEKLIGSPAAPPGHTGSLLNANITMACRVVTCRSKLFFPNVPFTTA
mmetsp:Transcript_27867/g.46838  ORF Transcript_27867/g.46838 Transcript_27867/m.46838 type:complete len:203 (+) Transcript_27867:373-981(+)